MHRSFTVYSFRNAKDVEHLISFFLEKAKRLEMQNTEWKYQIVAIKYKPVF